MKKKSEKGNTKKNTKSVSRKLSSPRGESASPASEGVLNKPKTTRTRKTSSNTEPKEDVLYDVYETKLPDGSIVKKRFRTGREVTFAMHGLVAIDKKWHVVVWSGKANPERRVAKATRLYVDETSNVFREKRYLEVRPGNVKKIGTISKKEKLEGTEDRTVFQKIRGTFEKRQEKKRLSAERAQQKKEEKEQKKTSKKDTTSEKPKKVKGKTTKTKKPVA